ncbi:hypothetical protein Rhe02_84280 [Rhizocola hellebori]|uniref:Uncharacterized protein n=1 Tax=Rhizocola hellebori TaxID=1392758 RepID=A0A8J3VLR2_9ACTN|nr:DUF3386 family protein [Rhizocola hellebori]GIH10361.1 hypothetical protein Rhe02_84280 [Rhizocola hellebori]
MGTDLLERAHNAAYRFPPEFAGFTATVSTSAGTTGSITVTGKREIGYELAAASEDDAAWLREQVASILGHRWNTSFAEGDGRFPHRSQDDGDPTGTLVHLEGDRMSSAYRVGGEEIREVHRTAGETRFTIVVSGSIYTPEGRLPNHFSVYYWDLARNRLTKADQYRDVYTECGGVFLPASRTITTADDQGLVTRVLTFGAHEVIR